MGLSALTALSVLGPLGFAAGIIVCSACIVIGGVAGGAGGFYGCQNIGGYVGE